MQQIYDEQIQELNTYSPVWNDELSQSLLKLYQAGFVFLFDMTENEVPDEFDPNLLKEFLEYDELNRPSPEALAAFEEVKKKFIESRTKKRDYLSRFKFND